MLEIIAGVKVETKSRWMYKQINENVSAKPDQPVILIVPEQFTLQAEKAYLESTGKTGILNPEVLSFNRLAYRVFQETGGRSRIVIDELGKHILIRKIVQDLAGKLLLYSGLTNERGFIDKIVDSITECKQYNISPEDLRHQAQMTMQDTLARNKLMDLALIYETFEERLKDRFVDREDQFQALIDQMQRSEFVKQTEFWIDGFFSFTPHMMRVVNKLCECASAVHLTAYGTDNELKHSAFPLFSQTRNLMQSVMQGDGVVNITDADPLSDATPQKPVIMHLSRTINQLPPDVWSKPAEGLTLFRAMNDDSEIEQIAARIMELVQDHNLRFYEISVLCAELEQRKDSIKRIFNLYGIPYFLDTKRRTVEHPLTQLISAGLETLRQGFTYHAIFRYIKTGYTGLSQDEIEMLENYVLARGIRGSMWKKNFTSEPESVETTLMNQLREKLMSPLIELESAINQSRSVKEMTAALFSWLQRLHVDHQINKEVKRYKQQEEYEPAALTTQLWNRIMALMDQMVDIMGETSVSLKNYQQLWQAGIESIEIGLIPSTIDQVMVGTPERSRQAGIKALFLMGVNDGVLPASTSEIGVLLTSEKMKLLQNGCLLGVFGEARQAQEELYVQLALSRPSEHLWISYSQATIEGEARRPSVLIERVKKIFPGLTERSDLFQEADAVLMRLRSPKVSYLDLASKLRDLADGKIVPDYWLTLFQWFNNDPEWNEDAEKLLTALYYHNQPPLLKQNQVEKYSDSSIPARSAVLSNTTSAHSRTLSALD
jgi:ATP-dependent helicase/nuclease subunit B